MTAIEKGTSPEPGFADGRAALALAEAAGESLRTGRAVRPAESGCTRRSPYEHAAASSRSTYRRLLDRPRPEPG